MKIDVTGMDGVQLQEVIDSVTRIDDEVEFAFDVTPIHGESVKKDSVKAILKIEDKDSKPALEQMYLIAAQNELRDAAE